MNCLVVFCTFCGGQITDEDRLRRNSTTCSDDHKRKLDAERRAKRAQKKCRLCGRGMPNGSRAEERRLRRRMADALTELKELRAINYEDFKGQVAAWKNVETILAANESFEATLRVTNNLPPTVQSDACAAAAQTNSIDTRI